MISKKAKYALLALKHLAKKYDQGTVLISEIATACKIPKKFLEAILLELRNGGFLKSKKGKGGGYYLAKPPDAINIIDILRLLDGPIALVPCVSLRYYEQCEECPDEEICGIRDVFLEVRIKTLEIFVKST